MFVKTIMSLLKHILISLTKNLTHVFQLIYLNYLSLNDHNLRLAPQCLIDRGDYITGSVVSNMELV